MIELDMDKWVLVKIACEKMISVGLPEEMALAYAWLANIAAFNAEVVNIAGQLDKKAQELIVQEPY